MFGLNEDPTKIKLFVLELYNESIIGKITQVTNDYVLLNRNKILIKDIKRAVKIIGIYQPIISDSPLENRFSLLENRLKKLEGLINNKW